MFDTFQLFQKAWQNDSNSLSKEQAVDADPKAIQQIVFPGNLSGNNNRLVFFLLQEWKKLF